MKGIGTTAAALAELASDHQPPCLSLYQPTHRHRPANWQDPIRFRNLVRDLATGLEERFPAADSGVLLEPLEALARDHDFWNNTLDGLAVFAGPGLFHAYQLQRTVPELAIVSGSFHTMPLRQHLQSVGRYQVLGLSLGGIQLFEGNRDALDEIAPAAGVPRTISEALGDRVADSQHLTVASYGGTGPGTGPMHHGHSDGRSVAQADAERFFRAIDRAVLEHHSRPSGLPLILAALPEHQHLFRLVSDNPFLVAGGLTVNPDVLEIDELRQQAWQVVEPQYRARLTSLADGYAEAQSKGLGSDDPELVGRAAAAGRVGTLMVEADSQAAGALNDLCNLVERMGGQVAVVPAELMPGESGLAATYRY